MSQSIDHSQWNLMLGLMPHGSNKEKASRENQKPNYEGPINMRSWRTKELNQQPKGVKNSNWRYDTPPKLSPGPYWLRARKLRQDHSDVTQSLKVRRPHCMSHFRGNVMLWRDTVSSSSYHKGAFEKGFSLQSAWAFVLSSLGETETVFVLLLFLLKY